MAPDLEVPECPAYISLDQLQSKEAYLDYITRTFTYLYYWSEKVSEGIRNGPIANPIALQAAHEAATEAFRSDPHLADEVLARTMNEPECRKTYLVQCLERIESTPRNEPKDIFLCGLYCSAAIQFLMNEVAMRYGFEHGADDPNDTGLTVLTSVTHRAKESSSRYLGRFRAYDPEGSRLSTRERPPATVYQMLDEVDYSFKYRDSKTGHIVSCEWVDGGNGILGNAYFIVVETSPDHPDGLRIELCEEEMLERFDLKV